MMYKTTLLQRMAALFALLAVLLFGHTDARAQEGDALLERLRTTYESIDALRAEFTQTMSSDFSDGEESFTGTLLLNGDRYRVDASGQTFVTNGEQTWIYNTTSNQVIINDYVKDETAFSLNDFFFRSAEDYTVEATEATRAGGETLYTLSLKPKSPSSFFEEVILTMRDRDNIVTRLEVHDVNGTTMVFDLTNIELNPSVDAAIFTFTPPEGAEVIDLRS